MNQLRHSSIALTVLVISGATTLPAADGVNPPFPDIAGPELWIDGPLADQVGTTKTVNDVAVDNLGRRIHVWSANSDSGDVFLRRWDAEGNPLEDPKLVNTVTAGLQDSPRVAVSADGSFLVIWQSREEDPFKGGGLFLLTRSRAYDADGDPVGSQQLVTTVIPTSLFENYADVAALRTSGGNPGGYIVVWYSNSSAGTDPGTTIQGCLVDANGVPGAQFQVNSEDAPGQSFPSVTELIDGGFLVVWSNTTTGETWGRRFNSAAGPIGNDFKISTEFSTGVFEKDATIGWDGTVAVVWADTDEQLPSTDATEIRMRLYNADLTPQGNDFRVNTLIPDDQRWPRAADFGPAGFLVTWQSDNASGDDLGDSIEARLVTGSNQFAGPQVQYNISDNNDTQDRPGSHGWYGRLATNWISPVLDGEPANNRGFVIGRDIEHCLFCDDFEWFSPSSQGSLWRWTSTLGLVP